MKSLPTSLLFLLITQLTLAQVDSGGNAIKTNPTECLSPDARQQIIERLKEQSKKYPVATNSRSNEILLEFPVRQHSNFSEWGSIGISNYVDLEGTYPDALLDYNCGTRTYDTESGYNHQGTDIFSWPFAWKKVDTDQVEIVAAAPGIILGKDDGNTDKSCSFNSSQWNAVYVRHDDGSIAWYGHLKRHSLTSKEEGERVETGEYLGVMASSGNSTGPHLHLELYDADQNLIDPYVGSCNGTTDRSWWKEQEPYRVPAINNLYTHSSPPVLGCYGEEQLNVEVNFQPGQRVYFATYFRDQLANSVSHHRVIQPDGNLFTEWQTSGEFDYAASYWYRSFDMPSAGFNGKWTFEVEYLGQVRSQYFYMLENSEISNDLVLSADTLLFDQVPAGTDSVLNLNITNTGIHGVFVEDISYPDGFSGNWFGRIYDGETKTLDVKFSPPIDEVYAGKLVLNTTAGGQKEVVLIGKTDVLIQRHLITERTIDFGLVATGESMEITTTFSNQGNTELLIERFTYPEGFTGPNTLTIAADGSVEFDIFFNPTEEKDYSGILEIVSNATGGTSTIALHGEGKIILGSTPDPRFVLYPNPNSSALLHMSQSSLVQIFNLTGMLVKEVNGPVEKLAISNLSPGLYTLIARNSLGTFKRKLVVR